MKRSILIAVAALAFLLPTSAASAQEGGRRVAIQMIVVPLEAPTDGSSEGRATVDSAPAREIVDNPRAFYVNAHNAPFGPGAVRGQLGR